MFSASLNQIPLDWAGNRQRAETAIADARTRGASWLCLPELALSGYGCEDRFLAPDTAERAAASLMALAPASKGIVVVIGLPLRVEGALYSVGAVLIDGQIAGFVPRHRLANEGLHYESRWFAPWPRGKKTEIKFAGRRVSVGDTVFDALGIRFRVEVGIDVLADDAESSTENVDWIFAPSANPFSLGATERTKQRLLEKSRKADCGFVYANLLGNEAGRILYDGAALVVEKGELVAEGPLFSYRDFSLSEDCTASPRPAVTKEEEFARAVSLGIFDYMRKSWSRGFVLSLSGGADSAAAAVLVRLMVDLATTELGEEGFRQRLAYLSLDDRPLLEQLLLCIYQATGHSTETTRHAAETLARGLGADYHEWNVGSLVAGYREKVEHCIGRNLSWDTDDLTLQNIQARVRAPGVWMLANLRGALLLATSNRSEAAVGYATMDGDTAGGLSPLAGIDKTFLRHWLRWMETTGLAPCGPIASLRPINVQNPTAELRPPTTGQTDESDLMPYPILNAIEDAAIRDRQSPHVVWENLCQSFPDHDADQLRAWVAKFYRLWSRNQWKRDRFAPSFHLDDHSLDPKGWCRFPLLSSGFREELDELG